MAMHERSVSPRPDVDREVMPQQLRQVTDSTKRNLRDWLIFRDYMIVLEYVKDVYKFFVDNPGRIKTWALRAPPRRPHQTVPSRPALLQSTTIGLSDQQTFIPQKTYLT